MAEEIKKEGVKCMTYEEELEIASRESWSVRPGEYPPGQFIGIRAEGGIIFRYYKDSEGRYYHTDSVTDGVEAEMKAARKRKQKNTGGT